jgi:hypothetical protein
MVAIAARPVQYRIVGLIWLAGIRRAWAGA